MKHTSVAIEEIERAVDVLHAELVGLGLGEPRLVLDSLWLPDVVGERDVDHLVGAPLLLHAHEAARRLAPPLSPTELGRLPARLPRAERGFVLVSTLLAGGRLGLEDCWAPARADR